MSIVSIVEVQRARREVTELARTADHSTFLVGELARQVSALRAFALDRLLRPPQDDLGTEDRRLVAISVALEQAVRELEPLLQPRERVAWHSTLRVLGRFRTEIARALGAIRSDRPQWARAVLLHRVPRLQERLDELAILNAQESRALIAAVDARLARTRAIEALLGASLVLALLLIWWAVQRTIARQRAQLDDYVARVEASNRDLDAFAGRIAHDVRNAVAPIGHAAAALRRAPDRADIVQAIAGRLERAARRIGVLLEGLLAFSRASAPAPDGEVAGVRAAVDEAIEELMPLAERVGASVDVRVEDVAVRCGSGLLHIVVANLVGNALKFLAGRPLRRVAVRARAVDGWCELVVADSGPGISDDVLPRVFEPFYRAPGATEPGLGIGLATVQRVVTAHGGAIAVESVSGHGTTFRLRLPLHERPTAVPASGPAVAPDRVAT